MILQFSYLKDKDIDNYLKFVWKSPSWLGDSTASSITHGIDDTLIAMLRSAESSRAAREVVERIIDSIWKMDIGGYKNKIKNLSSEWMLREGGFVKSLEIFYEKPFDFNNLKAYLTTLPICPYDYDKGWFMVALKNSLERQIKTVGHELMHFVFIRHYWDKCEKKFRLSDDKIDMIKEALTVFLNTEFKEWIKVEDKGYQREQELRNFLLRIRPKAKSFNRLLEEAVGFLAGA